jgi:PAS domain S-box-containing protein
MSALRDAEPTAPKRQAFRPERLAGVLDAVVDPISVQDLDGRIVFANAAAVRASGRSSIDDLLAAEWTTRMDRFELFDELARRVDPSELPSRVALRTGLPQNLVLRWRDRISGAEGWSSLSAVPLLDEQGRPEFSVNITHDITDSKLVEDALRVSEARSRLLADATRDLDESLDLDRTIDTAMALAVPHLADWATLDLVQPDGSVERVGAAVADAAQAELGDRMREFAVEPGAGRAGDRAIAERRPVIANISPETLVDDPDRPGLVETIRALGTTSAMAVPLMARGTVEGVLFLASCDDSRRYEEGDAVYAMELGRRIALAVGNARLYAAEQGARRAAEASASRAEVLLSDLEVQRNRFEAIIRNLPSGVIVAEIPSGRTMISNEALARILGTTELPLKRGRKSLEFFAADGRVVPPRQWPLARTIRTGEACSAEEMRLRRADGSDVWITAQSAPILGVDGRPVAGVAVFEDITARHHQQVHTAFLAESSAILTASLDYEDTIASVARLAVPAIADWSAVDVVGDDGQLRSIALVHADSGRLAEIAELRRRLANRGSESLAARVVQSGTPVCATITAEMIEQGFDQMPAVSEDEAAAIRSLAGTSLICVPLVIGGKAIGALTIAATGAANALGPDDIPFTREVAARAASAIQNARLFRDAARFRTILDAVRDGVTMNDPTTLEVTYANDAVLAQLGRTRDSVIGHATPDWTEDVSIAQLREMLGPLLAGEVETKALDVIRIKPDGTRIPVEIRWQMVDLAGAGLQLVAISRDIRDRIETEQRLTQLASAEHARAAELNTIIGAIGEGLVVMDGDGRITLANPTARALLEPLDDWTLDAVVARFDDPDGEAPAALTDPAVSVTLRLRTRSERWIEISNYRVGDQQHPGEDHIPGGEHIVILRDVTAAREREAVRDAFVGILSHELRTPVTTIYAGAKVLARTESALEPEARRGIFDDIHAEAERLHRLVEDVVALTRFGEGALEIGSEPVLLQRIIPTVVRSEQNRWPEGQFEVDIEGTLPPVAGDPTYVEQVIRNLLANAVKYGGRQTTIRLGARDEGEEVQVRVLDEGPGFPEDEAGRLFELYYRSPKTATQVSGSGIGLFVCARLLDAMGGRVWAANRPEGGAEFGFALRVMTEDH